MPGATCQFQPQPGEPPYTSPYEFVVTFPTPQPQTSTSFNSTGAIVSVDMVGLPAEQPHTVEQTYGHAGTSQEDASIAMTSSGNFVEVWNEGAPTGSTRTCTSAPSRRAPTRPGRWWPIGPLPATRPSTRTTDHRRTATDRHRQRTDAHRVVVRQADVRQCDAHGRCRHQSGELPLVAERRRGGRQHRQRPVRVEHRFAVGRHRSRRITPTCKHLGDAIAGKPS